ncbi:hypothetical protein B7P33_08850 [Sediminicola luteus]|uniref:Uncharacterized protein n=1 Tax=Sediminicola luteus TaxID=319238 RepID=A0A2A4G8U4_9FLAO|nr:hypothetical protein B7P33_08850 [Sediminicola luteus]
MLSTMAGTALFIWTHSGTLALAGTGLVLALAGAGEVTTDPVGAGVATGAQDIAADVIGGPAGVATGDLDTLDIITTQDIIPIIPVVGAIMVPVDHAVRSIHHMPLEAEGAPI